MSSRYRGNDPLEIAVRKKFSKIKDDIVYRTTNKNCPRYRQYGGRGVKLSPEWNDLDTFISEATKLPGFSMEKLLKGDLALDKDYLGDGLVYNKNSCKWVTLENNNQKKPNQQHDFTVFDTINKCYLGVFYNQSEVARLLGTYQACISNALRNTGVYKQYLIKWV